MGSVSSCISDWQQSQASEYVSVGKVARAGGKSGNLLLYSNKKE
jgi:hypothetical protein